ncbi:hypothetical protein A1O3_06002 [Capronia epimyces CBS 606.96]|uniref:Uncharacterized protein n=1 Tax=Capronia epimyces CBS 606.96 TaxID=1182542 RepID=W9YIR3_9EURO|nr:uncharacterized protein A1O3_06002 [Capronia epimyces CBS 606.96]EXJ82189.1 hypothetical protein A1O3_06002 [Capronia epimyces CBS 606.96]
MPHSPYTTTVHPPMRDGDLLQYEADLHAHRQRLENGESDKVAEEGLLENSEVLLEHCRFLDDKLIIRKRIPIDAGVIPSTQSRTIRRLETTVDDVTTECRDLRDRVQAQDAEIQDLRTQLEAARRAADLKKMEAEEDAAWSKIIDDALAEKTEE